MDSAQLQQMRYRQREAHENAAMKRGERMGRVVGRISPNEAPEGEGKKKKKVGGLGFWCILALAIVKDLADTLLTGTVVLSVVSTIISVFVICVVWFYFYYNDVSLLSTRKLAVTLLSLTADIIPFLAVLPGFTTMVLAVRFIENNEALKKVAEIKTGKLHAGNELGKTA